MKKVQGQVSDFSPCHHPGSGSISAACTLWEYCAFDSLVDFSAVYIVCLFTLYASPLIIFFTFYRASYAKRGPVGSRNSVHLSIRPSVRHTRVLCD